MNFDLFEKKWQPILWELLDDEKQNEFWHDLFHMVQAEELASIRISKIVEKHLSHQNAEV